MSSQSNLHGAEYKQVYDFVLACGRAETPKQFAREVMGNLSRLCSFDEGLVYFLDGNGKVYNQYLLNIDASWSTKYLEYYANTDGGRFSCLKGPREDKPKNEVNIRDWKHERSQEFVPDYIHPRRLKYSLGFSLRDLNGVSRLVFAMDRTRDESFSMGEYYNLSLAVPLLNHLHKNYFFQQQQPTQSVLRQIAWEETKLTPREIEIATLLCQGVTPANISKTLYIALPTTYKHISHIYEKMHVSSRQELLVRLYRQNN